MAYSAHMFRYYLCAATDCVSYEDRGNVLKSTFGASAWEITLGPERKEGIGLIMIDRMQMKLALFGCTREQGDAFLARFLRHYQRGGG